MDEKRLARYSIFGEIIKVLLEPISEGFKIEKITSIFQQYLGVSRCVILEIKEEAHEYEIVAAAPYSREEHGIGERGTIVDKLAIDEVIKNKKTLLIQDAKSNPLTSYMHHWAVVKNINAILFVPIVVEQDVVAIMVYDASGEKSFFSEKEVEFASACAEYIKELWARERQRERLQQQAQVQDELGSWVKFCSDAHHMLRTPLMTIGGFARRIKKLLPELAKRIPGQEDAIILVNKIEESMALVVSNVDVLEKALKDVASLAETEQALRLSEIDLNSTLTQVLQDLRNNYPSFQYNLNLTSLPLLRLDVKKVNLGLENILINAIEEASRQTEDNNEVVIATRLTRSNKAEVAISHYGQLRPETIKYVFQPFVVSNHTLKSSLGLPIAKRLIVLNGGDFTVKGEKEKVIYRITFPCFTKTNFEQPII